MRAGSPLLLVVSGLPASGKTFLSSHLAYGRGVPLVTRDAYKEILYHHLPDLAHAQAGPVSFSLIWHVTGTILAAGGSVVLETHFYRPVSEGHILELAATHGARLAQVHCEAPLPELKQRHAQRVASGRRPRIDLPFDHEELPAQACWHPLNLGAPLLQLDTTLPNSGNVALAWAVQQREISLQRQQKEETS
ncbi:AAA family ATPase [Deinococcus deserti]|uniref:Kinase n=1 Tax=Deinococcus deserti (strain DSM 17065 / CIP 109153 / LMG 22923 / VCD115) TaxID=546414 RepID=C1CZP3_DEIDV|nr:AAA family ATPase [Deinococcus deserti]ACO47291.1 hypothetical protein Deide_22600 [Deinococcus deserti VCD115]